MLPKNYFFNQMNLDLEDFLKSNYNSLDKLMYYSDIFSNR